MIVSHPRSTPFANRESFGPEKALDYLIGEKLFTFLMASEQDPEFAAEVPGRADSSFWVNPLPLRAPGSC